MLYILFYLYYYIFKIQDLFYASSTCPFRLVLKTHTWIVATTRTVQISVIIIHSGGVDILFLHILVCNLPRLLTVATMPQGESGL